MPKLWQTSCKFSGKLILIFWVAMIISCSNAVLYSVAYNLSFLFRGELSTGRPTWFIRSLWAASPLISSWFKPSTTCLTSPLTDTVEVPFLSFANNSRKHVAYYTTDWAVYSAKMRLCRQATESFVELCSLRQNLHTLKICHHTVRHGFSNSTLL